MTHTILDATQAAGELLILGVIVVVTVVSHALWQRRFSSEVLCRHNDVAGFMFSAVGVIYAVVLGFVVVVVWEKYDTTVADVGTEIAAVSDLYRTVDGFSEPARTQIRGELRQYTNEMINVEWPLMSQGVDVASDLALLEGMAHRIDAYSPETSGESNAQQMAQTQLSRLFDARRLRLMRSTPSVPVVLWFALVAGAVAMLAFAFLFGVENRRAQLVMTAILSGLIAVMFIVIYEFDGPFSGSVSISNDGWVALQRHLPDIR